MDIGAHPALTCEQCTPNTIRTFGGFRAACIVVCRGEAATSWQLASSKVDGTLEWAVTGPSRLSSSSFNDTKPPNGRVSLLPYWTEVVGGTKSTDLFERVLIAQELPVLHAASFSCSTLFSKVKRPVWALKVLSRKD